MVCYSGLVIEQHTYNLYNIILYLYIVFLFIFKTSTEDFRTEQRNTTKGAVYGTGNADPSGAPDFPPGF